MRLVADARGAFRAAPIEASLALLAAATFSVGVAQETWPDTSSRLLVTFSLAIPATFAFTLLHALGALRAGMRWALSLAAVALAGAFAFGVRSGYAAGSGSTAPPPPRSFPSPRSRSERTAIGAGGSGGCCSGRGRRHLA